MKYVCRMCRKEVVQDGEVYNHFHDGSAACPVVVTTASGEKVPAPDYDRHERLEEESGMELSPTNDEVDDFLESLAGESNPKGGE